MKKFLTSQFFKFSSMKVIHSIPGRVRFSVPGLKQVDNSFLHLEEELVSILMELNGVKKLSLSPITGKALVEYDQTRIDEKELLKRFKETWDTLVNEILELDSNIEITEELIRSFKPRLQEIIAKVNQEG